MAPRTCVIGAGVSGLVAGKSLRDWGVPYTCFEASDEIGGNWYFRNPNGRSSAYRSLHIDTSKQAISFADFPMDERYPDFPHHTQIHQFLREYADRFALRDRIEFETVVAEARRRDGGGWLIRTEDGTPARVRRAAGLQRPPLGPLVPGLPGHVRRPHDPLAPLHRSE